MHLFSMFLLIYLGEVIPTPMTNLASVTSTRLYDGRPNARPSDSLAT